ncbi:MAG: alpha/beta hydrolase, partial [Clostridiales bacterium]|nr:alpha/beta hydrolase [Candidatus Equinaster intestinalis]
YTLKDYADFVLEFIEKAGLNNPIIVGHSHGGRVALYLTSEKLLSPPKMILLDSAGLIPKKSAKQRFKAASFKAVKKVLSVPLWKESAEPLLDKARKHYGSADYNAAPPVLRKTLVNVVNTDLRDKLGEITCPTLLIWGENDTATPLSDAKIIESKIKDAGLCVIKGTGHFSFCEKPYEANAIIASFLG